MTASAIPGFPAPAGFWCSTTIAGWCDAEAIVRVGGRQAAIGIAARHDRKGGFVGEANFVETAGYSNEAPTIEAAQAEALDAGRSLCADALMAQFADRADALKFLALHLERTAARDAFAATRTAKEG